MANTSIRDFLLTPIVVPSLQDANYAESVNQSFETINSNFAKLISTPFLQGADGKDFELYKQVLFEDGDINDWGRALLYSIYKDSSEPTTLGSFNSDLRSALIESDTLDDFHNRLYRIVSEVETGILVSHNKPEFYPVNNVFADDSILDMPYVWTYVTKDDKGVINSQFVAQYYRFIDARLKEFRNESTVDYSNLMFDEISCFLTYDPDLDHTLQFGDANVFDRIYLTPTLRYDKTNGDWYWVIDGQETGISAKGIQGEPGESGARCWYGIVVDNQDQLISINQRLENIRFFQVSPEEDSTPNLSTASAQWVDADVFEGPKDGDLVFCLLTNQDITIDDIEDATYNDAFMGILKVSNNTVGKYKTFYNTQFSFYKYITSIQAQDIFRHLGYDNLNTAHSRGLWITSDPNLNSDRSITPPVHMIYADNDGNICFAKTDNYSWTGSETDSDHIVDYGGELRMINYKLNAAIGAIIGKTFQATGSIDLNGTVSARSENGSNSVSVNNDRIGISGNNVSIATGSQPGSCQINVPSNAQTGAFQVNCGDESLIQNTSNDSEKSINIPTLYSDKTTVRDMLGARKAILGDFCMIDPGITSNDNSDIKNAFDELYRSGGSQGGITMTQTNLGEWSASASNFGNYEDTIQGGIDVQVGQSGKGIYDTLYFEKGDNLLDGIAGITCPGHSSYHANIFHQNNGDAMYFGAVGWWDSNNNNALAPQISDDPYASSNDDNRSKIPLYYGATLGNRTRGQSLTNFINISGQDRRILGSAIWYLQNRYGLSKNAKVTNIKISFRCVFEYELHMGGENDCFLEFKGKYDKGLSNLNRAIGFWGSQDHNAPSGTVSDNGNKNYSFKTLNSINKKNENTPISSDVLNIIVSEYTYDTNKSREVVGGCVCSNENGVDIYSNDAASRFSIAYNSVTDDSKWYENSGADKTDRVVFDLGRIIFPPTDNNEWPKDQFSSTRITIEDELYRDKRQWTDMEWKVGNFIIKEKLKNVILNIESLTYKDDKSKNKFIICPKGIFFCDGPQENIQNLNIYTMPWMKMNDQYDINTESWRENPSGN